MARKHHPRYGSAGRLSSIGIEMGLAVVGGLLFGWWLDQRWSTEPWFTLLGLGIGAFAAFRGLYRAVKMHEEEVGKEQR